jgi:hypothetical protein
MIASAEEDKNKMPYLKSYQIENDITVNVSAGDFQPIFKRV